MSTKKSSGTGGIGRGVMDPVLHFGDMSYKPVLESTLAGKAKVMPKFLHITDFPAHLSKEEGMAWLREQPNPNNLPIKVWPEPAWWGEVIGKIGISKTIDDHFRDWENGMFGYGYGTGEPHLVPLVKKFLDLCHREDRVGSYDYQVLERELTPPVAWFLINMFCKDDLIEYGSSPRFGWLTDEGLALQQYVAGKTAEELLEIVQSDSNDFHCYKDGCNCGPEGYDETALCPNPFWNPKRRG